jgi:hypothetical protein
MVIEVSPFSWRHEYLWENVYSSTADFGVACARLKNRGPLREQKQQSRPDAGATKFKGARLKLAVTTAKSDSKSVVWLVKN